MGSGGGGGGDNTIRYAGYIEDQHKVFLTAVYNTRTSLMNSSPFSSYSDISIDDAFLGSGIAITAFSSLFDNYKDFLQDLDIETLYDSLMNKTLSSPAVKAAVVAEGALLAADIKRHGYPELMAGARDMNSVMSSTFVIAKGNLETNRINQVAKFSASLKYNLLAQANDRWKTTLDWNRQIVTIYAHLMQLYFSGKMDTDNQNYTMKAKNVLWPFTLLDHERAALGAMQGATRSSGMAGEASDTQKTIGGAMSGAAMGAAVSGGNPIAAGVGGLIGGLAGFLM